MSEQPKFTPGPWVGFNDHGRLAAIMPAGRPGDICQFEIPPEDGDGNLMIAAPDLYEALYELLYAPWELDKLAGGERQMNAQAKAHAALRKVIGEQP